MSGSPSGGGGHGAWHHLDGTPAVALEFLAAAAASTGAQKRKRRPAGTPDPGAEVVALSPKTLMESDRYICEICDQGFQRDQNLQMHRRRHKVPWKLLKKPSQGTPKRVYVCPERSCLHHNPAHALGDLVGIKKHFRRKHCTEKQWKCDKCSKRYAVQSDFKAHLKTCGTRGHCCGCGRVFSRVESFIEHQDACIVVKQATAHQSSGATIEKRLLPHQDVLTDKASHGSLSQSSDTTQAMSFAQSGVSERSGDSTKVPEHVLSAQPTLNAPAYKATIPPWLLDNRCRTELELLQPPDHSLSRVSDSTGGAASTTLSEDVNTPSLQLSIGSMGADTKPSPGSVEKEALALQGWISVQKYSRSRVPVGGPRTTTGLTSSRPYLENDVDLALSIRNQGVDARGTDAVNSFKIEVLEQAAERRKDETLSSNAMDFSFRPPRKHAQQFSWNPETVVNCNPFAGGSNSLFREDRARKIHDSESSEMGFVRKGTNSHQVLPEPAISSRQTLDLMDDSGKGAQLFFNSQSKIREAIKSEKQLAEFRVDDILACEQASTEANTAWEAARSRDDQARQANEQAPREFARGDWLRRDSHEHLQLASTECELARAKRMREPDFVSRSERSATFHFQGFAFCHSCKSALHTRPLGMNHR